jgi:hypothetical protein
LKLGDKGIVSYENNFLKDVLPKEKAARIPLVLPKNSINNLQYIDRPILNWGLAFISGHELLRKAIENVVKHANYFRDKKFQHMREPIIELTGPIMFTRTYYEYVEDGLKDSVTQCGIDFNGLGNPRMNGAWVRYAVSKSYVAKKNMNIL